MTHPTRGRTATLCLSAAAPAGGLVLNAPPHRLDSDCLSDALNLHHRRGLLCTRPALREGGLLTGGVPVSGTVPLAGRTLVYGVQGGRLTVALLQPNGTLVGTTHTATGVTGVCAVPAGSESTEGTRFAAVLYTAGTNGIFGVSETGALTALTPYVPTLQSGGIPTDTAVFAASGAAVEPFNRLAGDCLCGYTANGTGRYYWLPRTLSPDMAAEFSVTYDLPNAGPVTHHLASHAGTVYSETGTAADGLSLRYDTRLRAFWFVNSSGAVVTLPLADTADNVRLHAVRRTRTPAVFAMRFGGWYGGSTGGAHLFLSGAAEAPATVVWSAAGNPRYFPEDNIVTLGTPDSPVTALAQQDSYLAVFKSRGIFTLTLGTETTPTAAEALAGTAVSGTPVTVTALHAACGCDCPATLCLCGNRLVWLCQSGRVFTLISGGPYDRRCVRALSSPIEPALAGESAADLAAATAVYTADDYRLLVGGTVYVLSCTASGVANAASYASDAAAGAHTVWQRWQVAFPACSGLRLVPADGQGVLLSRTAGGTLCAHVFTADSAADRVPAEEAVGTLTFADTPVPVRLCTPWHEAAGGLAMQPLRLRLWVAGEAGAQLTVSLRACGRSHTVAQLTLTGEAPEQAAPRTLPLPAEPVPQCGIALETAGAFAWDRFELTYRTKGDIAHGHL